MSKKYEIKILLWVVIVGLLALSMMVGPELWAAPDQNPDRQTLPSRTPTSDAPDDPTSTSGPPPNNGDDDDNDNPPPPPPATATPVPKTQPTLTPTVAPSAATSTPEATVTATPVLATETGTPLAADGTLDTSTATPTDTSGAGGGLVEETDFPAGATEEATTASDTASAATIPADAGASSPAAPTTESARTRASSSDNVGANPALCGGIGLVTVGLALLFMWRLRG